MDANSLQLSNQPVGTDRTTSNNLGTAVRLHYLDWLRVLAILGVFIFHATHPFTLGEWHIKNAQVSIPLTVSIFFFYPWGMPFFFLIAGTGSMLALRRRSPRQFVRERIERLLIPYLAGSLLLSPIQGYLEWRHLSQTGSMQSSFLDFIIDRSTGFSPAWFDVIGYHLWFLGFLLSFSLLALPIFVWLKRKPGQRLITGLAGLADHRGGILFFILPLLVVQLGLRPFSPDEHGWGGFFVMMTFFVLGYILYADERFARAIRRDWRVILAVGIVAYAGLAATSLIGELDSFMSAPDKAGFYLFWSLFTINSWCWSIFMLFIGMRFLDFTNRWLAYGQEALLPFFVVHQPVIIAIAFYVVQWDMGIPLKLLIVVPGSFLVSLGLYELVIKHIGPLSILFGMKTGRPAKSQVSASNA